MSEHTLTDTAINGLISANTQLTKENAELRAKLEQERDLFETSKNLGLSLLARAEQAEAKCAAYTNETSCTPIIPDETLLCIQSNQIRSLAEKVKRLREFSAHKSNCQVNDDFYGPCDCGLKALAETEDAK